MDQGFQNITDFQLKSVAIAALGEIRDMRSSKWLVHSTYVESVTSPFRAATLTVVDSAGLLSDLPVQGGESSKDCLSDKF